MTQSTKLQFTDDELDNAIQKGAEIAYGRAAAQNIMVTHPHPLAWLTIEIKKEISNKLGLVRYKVEKKIMEGNE